MKRFSSIITILLLLSLVLSACGSADTKLESAFQPETAREIHVSLPVEPVVNNSYAGQFAVLTAEETIEAGTGARLCIDNTMNTVISSENAFDTIYPASITKIMTTLLVLEQGNFADSVTITEPIILNDPMAVSLGLQVGDTLTVETLMYGMIIGSANDCAVALGRYIAGSDADFVALMNQRALELGATHTHFTNPHGLHSSGHYTTAYDLYLIFHELIKHEEFRTISGTQSYTLQYVNGAGSPVARTISNSNQFITQQFAPPEGITVLAGKTGTTNEAGYCLIVEARDGNDHDYIAVVCGAGSDAGRYFQMQELLGKITK